jgi:hypothetical protein
MNDATALPPPIAQWTLLALGTVFAVVGLLVGLLVWMLVDWLGWTLQRLVERR